jgi:glycosyltransferase involved in cell wall biosynthesis
VVHTHLSVLRYALPSLIRRHVPAVVHTLHNLAERETDGFGRFLQWFAFRGVVTPVAISQEVAASMQRVYGLECKAVVPNCIPVDQYTRGIEDRTEWRAKHGFAEDDVVFVSVGRFEPQKNPMLLIDAFAALNDEHAHLVMLGAGSMRDGIAAHIRERGLGGRIHLLGKIPDIPEALAGSDVFALSSDWEGSPLAVIEAMAAGLPVIGTAVGGVPELVESGRQGILVTAKDGAAFAQALRALLDDRDKRAEMAAAAKARAHTAFHLDRMARGYADVYSEVLGRSSQSAVPTAVF